MFGVSSGMNASFVILNTFLTVLVIEVVMLINTVVCKLKLSLL